LAENNQPVEYAMSKTLEEVVAGLPEEDRGVVGAAIEAVKSEGLKKYGEARGEVARLLDKYKPLEKALREAGLDPSDQSMAELLKNARSSGEHSSELEKTVKALQGKLGEIEKVSQERAERLRQKTLTEKLGSALGPHLIEGASEYVISGLIHRGAVRLADDGETVVFVEGGAEQEFSEGVEAWKSKNKGLLKNRQAPGGGSSGGRGGGSVSDRPHLAKSEWDRLSPKDRARFIVEKKGVLTEG
jgi:hypothetical protein